jgi:hypothetical protein
LAKARKLQINIIFFTAFRSYDFRLSRIISCQSEATTNDLTHTKPGITFSREEECNAQVLNGDILAVLGQVLQKINFLPKMIHPPWYAGKEQQ